MTYSYLSRQSFLDISISLGVSAFVVVFSKFWPVAAGYSLQAAIDRHEWCGFETDVDSLGRTHWSRHEH